MPPSLTYGQVKGFAKSISKMILNGKFEEIVDTTKSDLKYLRELL
jgi:pyruvate dehydrogenase (quinone)